MCASGFVSGLLCGAILVMVILGFCAMFGRDSRKEQK